MNTHRHFSHLSGAVALAGLAVSVAACGSSGPSSSGTTTSPSATPSASASVSSAPATTPSSGTASTAAITANWQAFFSAKTPVGKRVKVLQDGSEFKSVIQQQAGSTLASQASAKVTHVTVNSPTQATVTYEILLDGTPALKKSGTAVLEDGTWKVGVSSFCGLLVLENAGKTSGLPAACKSTG